MEQKTPLYDMHVQYGGKMVPFAGYLLPVQYGNGIIAEHMAVRQNAGLFDVSHMGEVVFTGKDALKNINHLFTNDFTDMAAGRVRYSVMCYPSGGAVDDLIVYKYNDEKYFVVVNASNRHKDAAFIKANLFGDVVFQDVSDSYAQLALQGPKATEILQKLADASSIPAKYYTFVPDSVVSGIPCIVSKTGYTGEDGYEIYLAPEHAAKMWEALVAAGAEFGLVPCGLGARDTLRLEASMPLYGHELDENTTPLDAGLDFAVKMQKDDFIGKAALAASVPAKTRVGLKVTGRGIVREHCDLFLGDVKIGATTSGTKCPFIDQAVAMAYVPPEHAAVGLALEADVRGRRVECEIVPLPFYKRAKNQ